jgi:hypothetical protein
MKLYIILGLIVFFIFSGKSQTENPLLFKPNPEKEKMYLPYLAVRHGGDMPLKEWKKSNSVLYFKELWYYCESFYIKRNYFTTGVSLDESIIDISRFENYRKQNDEVVVPLEGFKDAVILLPTSKLLYKL